MEQKLPPDWEALVNEVKQGIMYPRTIVERCYALHSKPRKELTNTERENLMVAHGFSCTRLGHEFLQAIEAAVWAKQRELETVTFRAARFTNDGTIAVFENLPTVGWEWLDYDGKPQTFEVKLS